MAARWGVWDEMLMSLGSRVPSFVQRCLVLVWELIKVQTIKKSVFFAAKNKCARGKRGTLSGQCLLCRKAFDIPFFLGVQASFTVSGMFGDIWAWPSINM